MVDLPIELWDSIASQTTRHALLNLALVCTILSKVSRRALVHSILLDGYEMTENRRILMFIEEHNLAGLVYDLTVKGFNIGGEASTIPFGTMTNLKRINVYDCPAFCAPTEAQNALIHHIDTTFKDLRSLRIRNTYFGPLPRRFATIGGLREITWEDQQRGFVSPALFSLLNASRNSLQELKICIKDEIHRPENYIQLFSFNFPNLISLSLGPGRRTLFVDTFPGGSDNTNKRGIRNAFTSFLTANHTIRKLTLPNYNKVSGLLVYLQFNIPSPTSSFLPNLIILEAHPSLIAQLVRAKAPLFQSLETLSVQKTHNGDTVEAIDDMFIAFAILGDDIGQLPLRNLRLSFMEDHGPEMFSRWMITSAYMFPLLETIFSTTVPGKNIVNFPHFQHLRTISCILGCYHVDREGARLLVAKCPSLKRLSVRTPYKVFKFIHNEALNSTQISIYPPDDNQGELEDSDAMKNFIEWSDEDDDGDE